MQKGDFTDIMASHSLTTCFSTSVPAIRFFGITCTSGKHRSPSADVALQLAFEAQHWERRLSTYG
jgi:hypothetical protein